MLGEVKVSRNKWLLKLKIQHDENIVTNIFTQASQQDPKVYTLYTRKYIN